jgi:hypothetical protein
MKGGRSYLAFNEMADVNVRELERTEVEEAVAYFKVSSRNSTGRPV